MASGIENKTLEKLLWDADQSTVLSRTTVILNSDIFSDVIFNVGKKGASRKFHAHKLILSLASPVFANMFKNCLDGKATIEISDVIPRVFYKILKYLYTDILNFSDHQEARELYDVAIKYKLFNIQVQCKKYLCNTKEITLSNVISVFENAFFVNAPEILEKCYKMFEENTQAIFALSQFKSAKQSTVEAIIKRDKMNIESELEVFDAVIKWAIEECKRSGEGPISENLQESVRPLLKYIRFLSLPNDEFLKLVENTGIFTATEACRITSKLLQPQSDKVSLPPGICPIVQKRICPSFKPFYKAFPFPLVSCAKHISAQFNADIKSVIDIKMLKGQIYIIGVELQIQKKMFETDSLNVFLKLSNDVYSSEEEHTVNVTGEPLRIIFKEPLQVPPEHSATASITVEDLAVSRCFSCRQFNFESFAQPDVNFNVNLHGNRDSFVGIVCLVKEFLYDSC